MNHRLRSTIMALLALGPMSCGSGGGSSPTSSTASPQVGGQYEVLVRLLENGCGAGVTVAPQPTSVTHAPGASEFTLAHGGLRVEGSLSRDGAFTTRPASVQDPLGPATLVISGRFTTNGLEATVTVDVQPAAPAGACRYTVAWRGTKLGAPNVIG
jgi:hypothetical protein